MPRNKSRKEKIRSQKRREAYLKEIKSLNNKKKELEEKIIIEKKAKAKGFHIRNLKIFRETCNVLLPYVICAGVSVGGIFALKGGLPVRRDNIDKAKYTTLTIDDNGENSILETEYRKFGAFYDNPMEGTIIISSPWEEKDGIYTRYKREYNIDENQDEIISTILKKDYKRLYNELSDYKEEIETANYIFDDEQDYTIEGKISFLKEDDLLTMPEDIEKDIVITILEMIITFCLGGVIAWNRNFEFFYEIGEDIDEYRAKVRILKSDIKSLQETNDKLLTLTRRGRI